MIFLMERVPHRTREKRGALDKKRQIERGEQANHPGQRRGVIADYGGGLILEKNHEREEASPQSGLLKGSGGRAAGGGGQTYTRQATFSPCLYLLKGKTSRSRGKGEDATHLERRGDRNRTGRVKRIIMRIRFDSWVKKHLAGKERQGEVMRRSQETKRCGRARTPPAFLLSIRE